MPIISYAQNLEDVILWRALGSIEGGAYVDIGAFDPELHSVTKLFYDAGWRGVNVEPVPTFFERFVECRSQDTNVRGAVSANEGPIPFYEIAGTGLSTCIEHIALAHATSGFSYRTTTVESRTLAQIFSLVPSKDIHFLKIDVEGSERHVLTGADFTRYRPWVLVIEATLPMSRVQTHAEWEDLVTGHGYSLAYFDGLNRFYIPDEREYLRSSLCIPPNVFDDYIPIQHFRLQERVKELEHRLRALESS